MKKLILLSVNVNAEDIYKEQYEISGAEDIYSLLPPTSEKVIEELEIDISEANWVDKLSFESVFSQILDFFKSGLDLTYFNEHLCVFCSL